MSPRIIAGAISAFYGCAVLALDATNNPATLLVGLALLGVFVGVDGWQTRLIAPRHEFSDAVLRAIAALGAAVTVCPDPVPHSFDVWPPEPKESDR